MSSFAFSIHTSKSDKVYKAGEPVEGEVRIRPNKKVRCKGVSLVLQRKENRDLFPNKIAIGKLDLFEGELESGKDVALPFSFELPSDGPFSYDGMNTKLIWSLEARADIPWKIDPKASCPIRFEPGDKATANWVVSELELREGLQSQTETSALSATVLGYALGFSGFTLAALFFLYSYLTYGTKMTMQIILGGVFAVVGIYQSFSTFRTWLTERATGKLHVEFPPILCPGDSFSVEVRTQPNATIEVVDVTMQLLADEVVIASRSSEGRSNSIEYQLMELSLEREEGEYRSYRKGEPVLIRMEAKLPDDAPLSFDTRDLTLRWTLKTCVKFAGFPDWEEESILFVVPPSARDSILSGSSE